MARLSIRCIIMAVLCAVQFSGISTSDVYNTGGIKWRNVVPLRQSGRRIIRDGDLDLSYRRTKDIQDDINEEKYEEVEWREIPENKLQFDKLQQELQWLTARNEEGIGMSIS